MGRPRKTKSPGEETFKSLAGVLKALGAITSDEKGIYDLSGVHAEHGDAGLVLRATNNSAGIKVKLKDGFALPTGIYDPVIASMQLTVGSTPKPKPQHGTFPPLETTFPRLLDPSTFDVTKFKGVIGFDPALFAKVCRVLKQVDDALGHKFTSVMRVQFSGEHDPIRIDVRRSETPFGLVEIVVAVMPCRL